MDDAEIHFDPVLCMFWAVNAQSPSCPLQAFRYPLQVQNNVHNTLSWWCPNTLKVYVIFMHLYAQNMWITDPNDA